MEFLDEHLLVGDNESKNEFIVEIGPNINLRN